MVPASANPSDEFPRLPSVVIRNSSHMTVALTPQLPQAPRISHPHFFSPSEAPRGKTEQHPAARRNGEPQKVAAP